jgi:hypothetical protein
MTTENTRPEVVRVRITGEGIELEREIPVSLLPRLLALVIGNHDLVAAATPSQHTETQTLLSGRSGVGNSERIASVVEYLREKQPQTSSDTILVLGGYLELFENRRPFGRDDLRRLMRQARLQDPANFPRDVGVAVTKGYIQPLGDGFQLTNTGLELLRPSGPLVPGRGRAGPRARRISRPRTEDED